MNIKNRNTILAVGLIFALAAILLPAISSAKKQKTKIPVAWFNTSIVIKKVKEPIKIGYPKGWSIDNRHLKSRNVIMGGIMFYHNYYWFDNERSLKGWASVNIRWINTSGWETDHWPLDDFLKDKDCDILKCVRKSHKKYPSTFIGDSCKKTAYYPQMQGGSCGYFRKEIPVSGSPGYLFQNNMKGVSNDKTLNQTYLLFQKGKRIYFMEFSANEEEYDY